MAYCRFSNNSDVYVYKSYIDYKEIWVLHTALEKGRENFTYKTLKGLRRKLYALEQKAYRIPNEVYERIEKELHLGMKGH